MLEPVNERISAIIYKTLIGEPLEPIEKKSLRRWMKRSRYYRSLLDDVHTDLQLKHSLLQSYQTNRHEFWKIALSYRTALHDGMSPHTGNFWQRIFLFWR
ncbi:MAG: hypothetical protein JNK79_16680 [Chitinophagaceae bacterium]|nr:hypothetical protein [Chitinophagaceae bacterium]